MSAAQIDLDRSSHSASQLERTESDISGKIGAKRMSETVLPKSHSKEGIFSPVVRLFKTLLGDAELNKIRAKVISYHSDAIKNFVATAETEVGTKMLRVLFLIADRNGNGQIEEEELKEALSMLGFNWLKETQIRGIFERAGGAEKGYLTLEEWMAEAPKTLKTNLVKLAKNNGGDLGFLV